LGCCRWDRVRMIQKLNTIAAEEGKMDGFNKDYVRVQRFNLNNTVSAMRK
jgi:hypothetical protein